MLQIIIPAATSIVAVLIAGYFTLRARRPRKPQVNILDSFSTSVTTPATPTAEASAPSLSSSIGVEITDIDIPSTSYALDDPVVDVKFHNQGGQLVLLKRLTVEVIWARTFTVLDDLLPYRDTSGPLHIPPSAVYEVELPDPKKAREAQITTGISQAIKPDESDRILVRLKAKWAPSATAEFAQPASTSVYLLRLKFSYNSDRALPSRTIGVACPGNILFVPTSDGLKRKIARFRDKVASVQQQIDDEMASHGFTVPDWDEAAPLSRADLPAELATLRRLHVNDDFWDPQQAIARYLQAAERSCREITDALTHDMPDGLSDAIDTAQSTLARLPRLRQYFGVQ